MKKYETAYNNILNTVSVRPPILHLSCLGRHAFIYVVVVVLVEESIKIQKPTTALQWPSSRPLLTFGLSSRSAKVFFPSPVQFFPLIASVQFDLFPAAMRRGIFGLVYNQS